jgi:hypothetical protein
VRETRTAGVLKLTDLDLAKITTSRRVTAHQRPEKTLARSPGMTSTRGCRKARCAEVARKRSQASLSPREEAATGAAWYELIGLGMVLRMVKTGRAYFTPSPRITTIIVLAKI